MSQRTHRCLQHSPEAPEPEKGSVSQNSPKTPSETPLKAADQNPSTSEENQYVFVLNDKGEHVLKRKSEICETRDESAGSKDKSMPDLWDDNLSSNNLFNENWNQPASDVHKSVNDNNSNSDHDLFSMINEISSPSAEMKDLRLSSPVSEVQSEATNGSFDNSCISLSALQNINEDSLKELLNSISEK